NQGGAAAVLYRELEAVDAARAVKITRRVDQVLDVGGLDLLAGLDVVAEGARQHQLQRAAARQRGDGDLLQRLRRIADVGEVEVGSRKAAGVTEIRHNRRVRRDRRIVRLHRDLHHGRVGRGVLPDLQAVDQGGAAAV